MKACGPFSDDAPPLQSSRSSTIIPSHLVRLVSLLSTCNNGFFLFFLSRNPLPRLFQGPTPSIAPFSDFFFRGPTPLTTYLDPPTCHSVYCGHSFLSMIAKGLIFSPILTGSLVITSKKLIRNENYLSLVDSVEVWFISQGYENHLTKRESNILDHAQKREANILDRAQWRKMLNCVVFYSNLWMPKPCIIFGPIRLLTSFGSG